MNAHVRTATIAAALILAVTAGIGAQNRGAGAGDTPQGRGDAQQSPAPSTPVTPPPQPVRRPAVPLQVQVVVSKFQGDRRVSSMPYTMSVNANGPLSRVRMGAQVPVPSMVAPPTVDGKPVPGAVVAGGPVTYRDIGTNIDCVAASTDDGRFDLMLTIEDTSVYVATEPIDGILRAGELPVFRSFRATNNLVLRDGQSSQFTTATDRVNGEIIRIEVTLTVVR